MEIASEGGQKRMNKRNDAVRVRDKQGNMLEGMRINKGQRMISFRWWLWMVMQRENGFWTEMVNNIFNIHLDLLELKC